MPDIFFETPAHFDVRGELSSPEKPMDSISGERRGATRYSLQLKVRYRVMSGLRTIWRGTGYTADVSRTAVRLATSRALPVNGRVQLIIDWPIRFADMYPMELCVVGTVARSESNCAVVRMSSWQFRVAPGNRVTDGERAQGWAPRGRPRMQDAPPASASLM
jgi:hypothetical protein